MLPRNKGDVFRRQLLAEPFPRQWDGWLSANMAHYRLLSPAERSRLQNIARIVTAEKSWEGCDGLKVTELMKLTVAAQAALLLLGLDHDYFGRVLSIVLFPSAFELPAESTEQRGRTIHGQAVDYGSVFLSWESVLSEARNPAAGHNLVIHEFAHQLDFLDGFTNGAPVLRSRDQTKQWQLVMQASFQKLRRTLQQGHKTILGAYAATNPTEFFSVASEKFFSVPRILRENHPELFGVLAEYYRIDPLHWFEGKPESGLAAASVKEPVAAHSSIATPEHTEESGFIDFTCPYCGDLLSFPKVEADKLRECPNCLECMIVPQIAGQPARRILPAIQTERLVLGRLQSLDAKELADILSDSAALRFTEWNPTSQEAAEEWIENESRERFPKPHEDCGYYFTVKMVGPAKVIGLVQFWFQPSDFGLAQFEIVLHPDWQRKGYGIEAVRGLLNYAFNGLQAHRAAVRCDARNLAARRLFEKAGLRLESECIQDRFIKNEWVDTVSFAMLRREFESRQSIHSIAPTG